MTFLMQQGSTAMERESKEVKKASRHKRLCGRGPFGIALLPACFSCLLLGHIKHWLYDDDECHLGLHNHSRAKQDWQVALAEAKTR